MMEAYAVYPGSCGELIQGSIKGKDMLISFPVNLFTTVKLFESEKPVNRFKYKKASTLLGNMLKRWGYSHVNCKLDLKIESSIPQGKGFASSTADLCGVYICLLKLFKREYDLKEVVEEFIRIEPTDSIIFREMTLFDYKEGRAHENIGEYMKFHILAFEGNRVVDTLEFNKKNLPRLSGLDDIMPCVKEAIELADISKLSQTSTVSIKRNMNRLPYDIYSAVENLGSKTGGVGIIGGHSGNVLGIIYPDKERFLHAARYKDTIKGCKPHMLETLRRDEYERDFDYGARKWQR
jgi:L-threonine kinase